MGGDEIGSNNSRMVGGGCEGKDRAIVRGGRRARGSCRDAGALTRCEGAFANARSALIPAGTASAASPPIAEASARTEQSVRSLLPILLCHAAKKRSQKVQNLSGVPATEPRATRREQTPRRPPFRLVHRVKTCPRRCRSRARGSLRPRAARIASPRAAPANFTAQSPTIGPIGPASRSAPPRCSPRRPRPQRAPTPSAAPRRPCSRATIPTAQSPASPNSSGRASRPPRGTSATRWARCTKTGTTRKSGSRWRTRRFTRWAPPTSATSCCTPSSTTSPGCCAIARTSRATTCFSCSNPKTATSSPWSPSGRSSTSTRWGCPWRTSSAR